MRKLIVGVAAGLACSLIWVASASGCSCARPDVRTFRELDGAIVAKLVRIEPVGDGRNSDYVYRVREAFKKRDRFARGQIRRIRASSYGPSCGIEEPVGSTHGLFLYRYRGIWRSNLCLTTSAYRMRRLAARADRHRARGDVGASRTACAIPPAAEREEAAA